MTSPALDQSETPEVNFVTDSDGSKLRPFVSGNFEVIPGKGLVHYIYEKEQKTITLHINENEFYIDEIHTDTSNFSQKRVIKIKTRSAGGQMQTVYFFIEDLVGQNFFKWLNGHGLMPFEHKYNNLMVDFMSSYLASLQNRITPIERRNHFGWTTYTNRTTGKESQGFIIGNKMYTFDGEVQLSLDERCETLYNKEFQIYGDLETWKQIPKIYSELDQKPGQLMVCAAFAAPFMHLAPGTANNLIINLWDVTGGKGKTTALQIVNSVWGHPLEMISSKSDTISARYQHLGVRRNFPYCMDELTVMKDTDLSAMLYDIANGREKRKSSQGGNSLLGTGHWSTITLMTSNRSMHEMMRGLSAQTTAEIMRVIEINCTFKNYAGTPRGQLIEERIALMAENYGHAGRFFMERCFKSPGVFEKMTQIVRAWDQKNRVAANERFWSYGLATILTAGRMAVSMGLLDYDMKALEDWVLTDLLPGLRQKESKVSDDGATLLSEFLNQNVSKTLVVTSELRPKDARARDAMVILSHDNYVLRYPTNELQIRIEVEERKIVVASRAFEQWCLTNRCSITTILQQLVYKKIYSQAQGKVRRTLGKYVDSLNSGPTQCYVFDSQLLEEYVPRRK
jgi:hypothetical protein